MSGLVLDSGGDNFLSFPYFMDKETKIAFANPSPQVF